MNEGSKNSTEPEAKLTNYHVATATVTNKSYAEVNWYVGYAFPEDGDIGAEESEAIKIKLAGRAKEIGLYGTDALEGGAETDFLGAHFAAQLAPLRFVLVSLGVAEHVADDGVAAFLDGGNEHGVVVVVGENFRVGGIPGGVRGDVPENLKYLVRLFLAEVGGLEHNIETDGGRVTLAQVLDYVGVHVAVPFVKGT